MQRKQREAKDMLPTSGIWSVEDLAAYLGMTPSVLLDHMQEKGIPILHLGNRYNAKLFRLEDLKPVTSE